MLIIAIALTWGALHERQVEHAKDTKAAVVAVAHVTKEDAVIEQKATNDTSNAAQIYKQIVQLPAVADLGVVCHDTGRSAVPSAATSDSAGHPTADSGAGAVFDPSGDILTVGRKYDAWIRDLQLENAALRAELEAANKVHK